MGVDNIAGNYGMSHNKIKLALKDTSSLYKAHATLLVQLVG